MIPLPTIWKENMTGATLLSFHWPNKIPSIKSKWTFGAPFQIFMMIHHRLIPSLFSWWEYFLMQWSYAESYTLWKDPRQNNRITIIHIKFLNSVWSLYSLVDTISFTAAFCIFGRFQKSEGIEIIFSYFPYTHQYDKWNHHHQIHL